MSEVTYLSEFRDRRARSKAAHPSTFRETDLQPHLDAIDEDIRALARLTDCRWLTVDETHHFTKGNPAWDKLMADILARSDATHWSYPPPERREKVAHALRILRSTDQGSDGGDAEGHQGDDRPA